MPSKQREGIHSGGSAGLLCQRDGAQVHPAIEKVPNRVGVQFPGFNFGEADDDYAAVGKTDPHRVPLAIDRPGEPVENDSWRAHVDGLLSGKAGTRFASCRAVLLNHPFVCASHERQAALKGPAPSTCDVRRQSVVRLSELPEEIDFRRRNLRVAEKRYILINHKPWGFDVAT